MKRIKTFKEIFTRLNEEELNKTALVCGKESFTYKSLDHAIDLCASRLIDMGVKPGDRVGLWTFNTANALVSFFGVIRAGGVAVLCNYSLSYEEALDQLRDCDLDYLLYGKTLASRNDPQIPLRLATDLKVKGSLDINPDSISFNKDEEVMHAGEIDEIVKNDDPHRDAYVIFTTGTTSKPKAVLDHQEGLLTNVERFVELRGPLIGDTACVSLPFFHIFGLHMLLANFYAKATVYYSEKVGAEDVAKNLLENGCVNVYSVTAVYLNLLGHPDFSKFVDQVKCLTTGGGGLTPVQFMKIEMAFPNAKLFNEYGQSETHGSITMYNYDEPIEKRAFTVGKPYKREEVVILGAGNEIVKDGEPGEIAVKNITKTNGYYKLPEDRQPTDANGYLHTGDLGVYDQEGYIHLVGRAKDLIIKNGENIAPAEVENVIAELPGIEEVKVYGVRHNIWGESVECCVRLAPGTEFDEAKYLKSLKGKMASIKIPSHIIPFDSFPLAPSGKVDAKGLRIRLVSILKDMYMRQKLEVGVDCFTLCIKSTEYNIVPSSVMLRSVAESVGFDARKVNQIALAVEEFLRLRIVENSDEVGDIKIRCIFYPHYLSIEFSDKGPKYYIEKNTETSLCAKLIVAVADNLEMLESENEATRYYMEFKYPKEIDIEQFLLSKDHEIL